MHLSVVLVEATKSLPFREQTGSRHTQVYPRSTATVPKKTWPGTSAERLQGSNRYFIFTMDTTSIGFASLQRLVLRRIR